MNAPYKPIACFGILEHRLNRTEQLLEILELTHSDVPVCWKALLYCQISYGVLRIWFDVLTPKEVLFFESMIARLKVKHKILCTSRDYREVNELARIRRQRMQVVGRHGGATLAGKLEASLERMSALLPAIRRFAPDAAVSFCSPDAARVAFGLKIPHIGFSNAPHHHATLRLSVPLLHKLLISANARKRDFTRFGIDPNRIVQYQGLDEYLIIRNRPASRRLPIAKKQGDKLILFRTYEVQASYVAKSVDMVSMIAAIVSELHDCRLVVLGRYYDEIRHLQRSVGDRVTVLDAVVDSGQILPLCNVFIGSGGTMTSEAALRGIPTISYNAVPNVDERNLVRRGLVWRAESASKIVRTAKRLLASGAPTLQPKVERYLAGMEDPYDTLATVLASLEGSAH